MAAPPEPSLADELAPNYVYVRDLGRGAYGRVVLCHDVRLANLPVAVKLIERGSYVGQYKLYVAREIIHHGSLMHPMVVGFYEAFLTPRYLALAMEYAAGGTLLAHLGRQPGARLGEAAARALFQQLVIGLQYIHARGIANRDLKLDNLLLAGPDAAGATPPTYLKICDFGFSKHQFNSAADTKVGTPAYMSPEVIRGGAGYDAQRADIWSAGVVLYVLLTGKFPFGTSSDATKLSRAIVGGRWAPMPPELGLSPEAVALVAAMLRPDPQARPSVEDIFACAWFQADLPPEADQMTPYYLKVAPDAAAPPLAAAIHALNEMVERGRRVGGPGEERVACEFPCRAKLREAMAAGALDGGGGGGGGGGAGTPGGGSSTHSIGAFMQRLAVASDGSGSIGGGAVGGSVASPLRPHQR